MQTSNLNFSFEMKTLNRQGICAGYASVFNNVDDNGDIVCPGAFSRSINAHNNGIREIKVLWQHKMDEPIGKVLLMHENERGLFVVFELSLSTIRGKEAYDLLKDNVINGLSIGFRLDKYDISQKQKARLIKEVRLLEISLVTIPANSEARITDIKTIQDNLGDVTSVIRRARKVISS